MTSEAEKAALRRAFELSNDVERNGRAFRHWLEVNTDLAPDLLDIIESSYPTKAGRPKAQGETAAQTGWLDARASYNEFRSAGMDHRAALGKASDVHNRRNLIDRLEDVVRGRGGSALECAWRRRQQSVRIKVSAGRSRCPNGIIGADEFERRGLRHDQVTAKGREEA
jgi:hypothetical protein